MKKGRISISARRRVRLLCDGATDGIRMCAASRIVTIRIGSMVKTL